MPWEDAASRTNRAPTKLIFSAAVTLTLLLASQANAQRSDEERLEDFGRMLNGGSVHDSSSFTDPAEIPDDVSASLIAGFGQELERAGGRLLFDTRQLWKAKRDGNDNLAICGIVPASLNTRFGPREFGLFFAMIVRPAQKWRAWMRAEPTFEHVASGVDHEGYLKTLGFCKNIGVPMLGVTK